MLHWLSNSLSLEQPEWISGSGWSIGVDIWGIGICLLEFVHQECPYHPDLTPIKMLLHIKNRGIWFHFMVSHQFLKFNGYSLHAWKTAMQWYGVKTWRIFSRLCMLVASFPRYALVDQKLIGFRLHVDPETHPNAHVLLRHPWIASIMK